MNRRQLKRFLDMIEECDWVQARFLDHTVLDGIALTQGMRDAIVGVAIQRKNNLLEQLHNRGIHLDEEV